MLACFFAAAMIVANAPRIVSLIPSITEDLFAIGAGAQVVGTSQFTDYPPAALAVPQVASFASVNAERIVRLHPDVVIGIPAQASLVGDLRRAGLRVVLLPDDSFAEIFTNLRALGALSGHAREAATLSRRLLARTAELVRSVPAGFRPRTFVVLEVAPAIETVGNRSYISHLLELAGARNASGIDAPYAQYGAEAVVAAAPDAVIADAQSGLAGALARPPWNALGAVRAGRVSILQNADILERPGPRYNDGLAWLIAHLHPRVMR